ncbi:tRNA 4-thiouridine(8) synthase ThiI [Metabacillus sp. GX 13764]|uniref:tRNA uracil 4-sulfurtransferase ThiI n=1 Tax=Metabacillus kandeliae TaxID=2900151 RepID=UPI001E57AB5B|nr:tRNA uracil 4-sulfurtransferase ThiI [Metabacillus kandeliae]MCD7032753.1 tRNA 4-thiouridine(8) synthase ThiI [Metabacillus kandeliae]
MQYDHILIRFGEISTKGRNRKQFVDRLKKNIQLVLQPFRMLTYTSTRDRIYIKLNGEPYSEIKEKLKPVFGIQSFSLAVRSKSELEEIKTAALETIKEAAVPGDTFKVSARRADKNFPVPADELNREIGGHILRNTEDLTVNVRKPVYDVRVEVREEATFITTKDELGAGGMPAGTSGRGMLMLSGGFDSPVAGYLCMKRGVEIEAVHFFSPPYTSERAKQKVLDLAAQLTPYCGSMLVHIVPFTAIQELIHKQVPENYTMTSTRRMMLKITDAIRSKREGLAIITGESIGQVASQTLHSMQAINEVTSTPVLRPLLSMDKTDIMELAKKIDTHDISILPYEDCCTVFTPAAPKTKPKLEKVERFESFVDFDSLIKEALENMETIKVSHSEESPFAGLL